MPDDTPVDNVVPLFGFAMHDFTPAQVFEQSAKNDFTDVLVIGTDREGRIYMNGTSCDLKEVMWLLFRADNCIRDYEREIRGSIE